MVKWIGFSVYTLHPLTSNFIRTIRLKYLEIFGVIRLVQVDKLFNQEKVGNRTHYKQVVADIILRRQATLQDSTCENTIKVNLNTFEKGWENIITTFEKKTGKEYARVKYKHKWDALKKDWVLWNKLKGSETGLRWYAAKGRIAATNEWWERKLMCFIVVEYLGLSFFTVGCWRVAELL
ncbi:l10-interacting myb domain-containing protein [Quercus suber]|uniref:L10-interacting myb domain-containing protein n=1 Tax=Quercus suber TaxID=58331 RepID=A0AAW0J0S3_QUESU